MKKLLSILLILAMLIPAASLAAGGLVGPGKMYVYTSNGKSLNVRSEPRTGDNIIGHLKYGAEVNVVEFYNGWTEISWGDTTAYVQSRFLQWYVPGPKPQPEPTEDPEKEEKEKLKKEQASEKDIDPIMLQVNATRSTGWINIRSVPSKLGKRIESCADGTLLQADGETDKWYRVTDQMTGKSGYIFKMYTTVMPKPEPVTLETEAEIGKLNVNGEFDLQCRIPEGYKLQVISSQGGKIIAETLEKAADAGIQKSLLVPVVYFYGKSFLGATGFGSSHQGTGSGNEGYLPYKELMSKFDTPDYKVSFDSDSQSEIAVSKEEAIVFMGIPSVKAVAVNVKNNGYAGVAVYDVSQDHHEPIVSVLVTIGLELRPGVNYKAAKK